MTRTVFTGGTVIDGTGAAPGVADVSVDNQRLVDIGTGLDGDVAVDATGCTVLPGLFDCHTHVMLSGVDWMKQLATPFSLPFFEAAANLRTTLACGITSIRDAGGADLGVAEAVRTGLTPGPRIQISVTPLSQTGGHADGWMPCGTRVSLFGEHPGRPQGIVDGPDEARRKVREVIRAGADVIKIMTSGGVLSPRDDPRHGHLRDDEVAVMVAEATAVGKFVMSHAQATDGIKTAVRNGVRSIEHGIYLDDEAIEMMLEHSTWLVPTLMAPRMVLLAAEEGAALTPAMVDKARLVLDHHTASIRAAVSAGVRVAMGTDSGVRHHGQNLDELGLLVDCGMAPLQALHTATRSAAELLGVDDELGTLQPGKRADLVLVEGDALEHVQKGGDALRAAIREVWLDGRRVHTARG